MAAFVPSAALPLTRHLNHLHIHRRLPLPSSSPFSHNSLMLRTTTITASIKTAQKSATSATTATSTTSNNATAYTTATGAEQTDKRGFDLLRDDISRLSRLLRGDFSAISPPPPPLYRYDSSKITSYYDRRPLTSLLRASAVGIPFFLWFVRVRRLDPLLYPSPTPSSITARRASQLRSLLTWAGPTYLKIGQAIGNRPDLVGAVYSNELQKLVDDVGVFSSKVAKQIVLSELKIDQLSDVFEYFETEAMASASLGQVHRAVLKSGEKVAIKVQRPTVERDAALDVYILRKIAEFSKKRFKLRSDIVGIVDEFATRLWEEIDYINEADNCERFGQLYCFDPNVPNSERDENEIHTEGNGIGASIDIYVPKVYREFTTKRVLCLEWINGQKAPWFPLEEARRLVRVGVQCSLNQLLTYGFVHADPHAGNLLRTASGKLCYLDFGMCVSVPEQLRNDLIVAIVRLINRDFENLGDSFIKLGFLPPDADTSKLAPLLIDAFGDASTGDSLSDLSFSRLANNLSGVAFNTPIRIPVFFTLIIRSLTILEGLALQTDSSFKIVDEAYPYVSSRILTGDSPVFRAALRDVLIDRSSGRLRWNRLSALLSSSNEGEGSAKDKTKTRKKKNTQSNHDVPLDGVSERALNRVIDFALSERGEFLRDALIQEVVDTADAMQLLVQRRASQVTRGVIPAPDEDVDLQRIEQALKIAKLVRLKAPELLEAARYSGRQGENVNKDSERLRALQSQMAEASRVVVGSIVERNTRRILRGAVSAIFGPRSKE